MRARDILVGACLALALAGFPGAPVAQGAGKTEVQRPNTEALVFLGKSQGYELSLSMPNPRAAVLHVGKSWGEDSFQPYAYAAYGVRTPAGALEKGVIRARFPSLGSVTLRFDPDGKRRVRPQGHCRGKPTVVEYGTFRGTVSLEGEGGYFKLDARSGEGLWRRSSRLLCGKENADKQDVGAPLWEYVAPRFSFGPWSTVALLYALARERTRSIAIRAAHGKGEPPGAEVQLGTLELRPGMAIGRAAFVEGGSPGTLTTSAPGVHPASATLAPPPPFYGEARYFENSATSHSWTGTLGVSLPGLDLSLAGEQFKTSLCVVSPLKVPAGCDFIEPKPLRGV